MGEGTEESRVGVFMCHLSSRVCARSLRCVFESRLNFAESILVVVVT